MIWSDTDDSNGLRSSFESYPLIPTRASRDQLKKRVVAVEVRERKNALMNPSSEVVVNERSESFFMESFPH